IKDPTGRVVFPIRDNQNGQALNAFTSNITSYNQAVAGPAPIAGASGYTPFIFDPSGLPAGDYYIEFSRSSSTVSLDNPLPIEWFDITVATKGGTPQAIDGRVFSRNWALFAPSPSCGTNPTFTWFDRAFNGSFFVYTDQNIVTEVDFAGAGFQPAAFNVVFNDAGTTRTGDVITDRKSLNNVRSSASQHRIFLNDPDINIYPSGVLGQFSITPKFIACENGTACVEAAVSEPGQIDVLVDLDTASGKFVYDIGSADVLIAFQVNPEPNEQPPYLRCIPWDGVDGLGVKLGQSAVEGADLLIRYTQGIYHFPIYDAEYKLGGFDVTTIRPVPNNGSPKKIYYDDTNIPDAYGPGVTQPRQDPFNGCSIPCHFWTNRDFGNDNTINSWFFAREEYELQIELGNCPIDAQNDSTRMAVNTSRTLGVLNNDLGTDQIDTTSIGVGEAPLNGIASFDTTTYEATYTPNPGFVGRDSFTYVFCYGILPVNNLCDTAEVYVVVEPRPEDCKNMFDDDGDGLADCNDPDCQFNVPAVIQRRKQESLWWMILLLSMLLPTFQLVKRRFLEKI
ncbi:MAG: Ig-like domain-containing protein, partial [Bacteroidota bacterium]